MYILSIWINTHMSMFQPSVLTVIIKGFMAKCDKSGFWVKTTSVFHPQNINENLYVILGYLRNAPSK